MFSVLPIPYEEAVAMVRRTSAAAFGEGSFVERKTEVFPHERPLVPQPPGNQRIEDEEIARLSQLGISPSTWISESIIHTVAYNTDDRSDDHSVLYLRIADAQPLFKQHCALLAVGRVDHTREWLRSFHLQIPLPMKGDSALSLVTETEVQFLRSIEARFPSVLANPVAFGVDVDDGSSPFISSGLLEALKPIVKGKCAP
jgi:hypothetical protein